MCVCTEKPIFLRERASNCYSVGPYYLARITADLPSQILAVCVYFAILYWMVNLNSGVTHFFIALGLVNLSALCAHSQGMAISAAVPNAAVGTIVGPISVIFQILFAGPFVTISDIVERFSLSLSLA